MNVVNHYIKVLADNLLIDSDCAPNYPLKENLFLMLICILNKIPLIVIGNPGQSKTLALNILIRNMKG